MQWRRLVLAGLDSSMMQAPFYEADVRCAHAIGSGLCAPHFANASGMRVPMMPCPADSVLLPAPDNWEASPPTVQAYLRQAKPNKT